MTVQVKEKEKQHTSSGAGRDEAIAIAYDNPIPVATRGVQKKLLKQRNIEEAKSRALNWHLLRLKEKDKQHTSSSTREEEAIAIAVPVETRGAISLYKETTNQDTKRISLNKSEHVDIVIQRLIARKRSLAKETREISETIRILQLQKDHL